MAHKYGTYGDLVRHVVLAENIPLQDSRLRGLGDVGDAMGEDGITVVGVAVFGEETNEPLMWSIVKVSFCCSQIGRSKGGVVLTENAGIVLFIKGIRIYVCISQSTCIYVLVQNATHRQFRTIKGDCH